MHRSHTSASSLEFSAHNPWHTPCTGIAAMRGLIILAAVRVTSNGYRGGGGCASGIVRGAISVGDDGALTADLPISGLFVDVSVDPTGSLLAIANPGARGVPGSLIVTRVPQIQVGSRDPSGCEQPIAQPLLTGQATSVAFVSEWLVAVQEREPAAISFFDVRTQDTVAILEFNQESREDTGHTLFHVTTDAGVACASCHVEAGDDGHVWNFDGIGPRRTQNVRGGILGSEPFHWNGDMPDFSALVTSVFEVRMGAPPVSAEQARALSRWIDGQPALRAKSIDLDSVQRGKALFESEELGCTQCHSGARLRSNESKDVGTGVILQVPSLQAVSFRAPFMHDGCAKTLEERFAACGGGDKHGKTSQLHATDVGALVAYLESL